VARKSALAASSSERRILAKTLAICWYYRTARAG
jgi:hypothetical protein